MTNNTTTELLDTDGENRAVRSFLMQYGVPGLTVGAMRQHMSRSGWGAEYCPQFVNSSNATAGEHLTKAGAQIWIRHLFSLEGRSAAHGEPSKAAPTGFDAEFLSKRLGSVAKLAGVPMPDLTHEQIADCAGAILGTIASKLEAASKAGSAEQVSERGAFEKCESAKGNRTWLAKNEDGSYHSYEINKSWKDFQAGYSAAIQSAPERQALSDAKILAILAAHEIGWGDADGVTPFNGDVGETYVKAIRSILAAQASAQSTVAVLPTVQGRYDYSRKPISNEPCPYCKGNIPEPGPFSPICAVCNNTGLMTQFGKSIKDDQDDGAKP